MKMYFVRQPKNQSLLFLQAETCSIVGETKEVSMILLYVENSVQGQDNRKVNKLFTPKTKIGWHQWTCPKMRPSRVIHDANTTF